MHTILFDWDGTIVDSVEGLYDAYAVVCRRFGLPLDRTIFRRAFAPDWRLMYRTLGMPEDRIEEAGRVWTDAYQAGRVRLFPGVEAGLERLAAAGYALGIVTGGYHEVVWPQLERLGLSHLFSVRVFGNDTMAGKPDPRPLRLALERAGRLERGGRPAAVPRAVAPEDAAYLGDALDDMRMAAAAAVRGVGIVSLIATADELLAAGATETASSTVEWIDRLLRARLERRRGRGAA